MYNVYNALCIRQIEFKVARYTKTGLMEPRTAGDIDSVTQGVPTEPFFLIMPIKPGLGPPAITGLLQGS